MMGSNDERADCDPDFPNCIQLNEVTVTTPRGGSNSGGSYGGSSNSGGIGDGWFGGSLNMPAVFPPRTSGVSTISNGPYLGGGYSGPTSSSQPSSSSSSSSPASWNMGVPPQASLDYSLIKDLNITDARQLNFLQNNSFFEDEVRNFLYRNKDSYAARSFALEAIKAKTEGGSVDFEEQIIDKLTGKAKCVYEKLKSSSTSFKDAIKKFDGDFPVAHLKFEIDFNESSNTRKAYATPPSNYLISIVINGNSTKNASYQQRPNLMVAKTIIHEVIHAEMWRKILSIIDNGGNIKGITRQQWVDKLSKGDYPGIFDYYTRFGINGFQHPQMAAKYRNVIADAMENFDNNANPRQLYEDLAWEGLIYNNDPTWSNLSQSKKIRIQNTIKNYFNQNKNESCN